MNFLKLLGKKGISTDILDIIVVIVVLAVAIVIVLLLSGQGKLLLGNLTQLNVAP
jgi:hypothetical protein